MSVYDDVMLLCVYMLLSGATELTTCVPPAKRVCQRLSSKRKYTIEVS